MAKNSKPEFYTVVAQSIPGGDIHTIAMFRYEVDMTTFLENPANVSGYVFINASRKNIPLGLNAKNALDKSREYARKYAEQLANG